MTIWYQSSDTGAPTLNNAPGSMAEVLRSCLVLGYNPKSVTSIAVSNGVATATCAGHGYSGTLGKLVLLAGAGQPLLNGRKQLTSVSTNAFTFAAAGVPDGTYTGAITARRAPLGWAEQHSATNVAIFARSTPEATAMLLRIDDTNVAPASAAAARVLMLESATDANTFEGRTPTEARLAGGQYWLKGADDVAAKGWILVGDGLRFYFFTLHNAAATEYYCHGFGDLRSYRAGDAFACFLAGHRSTNALNSGAFQQSNPLNFTAEDAAFMVARPSNQLGSGARLNAIGISPVAASNAVAGSSSYPAYPSPVDNGCVLYAPILVSEDSVTFRHPIRGEIPGVAHPLGAQPFTSGEVVPNVVGSNRAFVAVRVVGVNGGGNAAGQILLDITGPW